MLQRVFRRLASTAPMKDFVSKSPLAFHSKPPTQASISFNLLSANKPDLVEPSILRVPKLPVLDSIPVKTPILDSIKSVPILNDIPSDDNSKAVVEPTQVIEKQAARLIVIRRRKMKRHKLKKLRRKMKFEWAKLRQRREMKKEKAFQAELMEKVGEAEKFNAAAYVMSKIDKANERPLPKLWRGKRLPEFVIKDLLAKQELKRKLKIESKERRKKMPSNVDDYNV